jgi:cbb3-type cytochrome oxidase subunit 1
MSQISERISRSSWDAASPRLRSVLLYSCGVSIVWFVLSGLLHLACFLRLAEPGGLNVRLLSFSSLIAASSLLDSYSFVLPVLLCGSAYFLVARLGSRSRLDSLLGLGLFLVNVGCIVGLISVFFNGPRVYAWDQLSPLVKGFQVAGMLVICVWFLGNHFSRGEFDLASHFLLSGFFWVAAVHLPGSLILGRGILSGVQEVIASHLLAYGFKNFVVQAFGLGLVGLMVERDCRWTGCDRGWARLCFWMIVFFGALGGLARLSSGPLPLWVGSVSVAASLISGIPYVWLGCSLLVAVSSVAAEDRGIWHRFLTVSLILFIAHVVMDRLSVIRGVDAVVRFSLFDLGLDRIFYQGFLGFLGFACLYGVLSALFPYFNEVVFLKGVHCTLCTYGCGLVCFLLVVSGFLAGGDLLGGDVPFAQVIETYSFFSFGLIFGGVLYLAGLAFMVADIGFGWLRSRL